MSKAKILLSIFATALFVACGTTRIMPIMRRKQDLMVSDEQVLSLSKQEYDKYMTSVAKSFNAANTATVRRVGQRLARVVETYFSSHGLNEGLQHYSWGPNLVADEQANAFCIPGGKIVVYKGLLPYTQDGPSLVVVVDHEIAYAVACRSAGQVSKQIRDHLGVQVLDGALGAPDAGNTTIQIVQMVAQRGLQFRNLKYSRDHELEVDNVGLIFATTAGHDPRVAAPLWQRTANDKENQSDMFSTHPVGTKRIAALQHPIPTAL